eukprot:15449389-Alexandrium_andersonii.AAC.1
MQADSGSCWARATECWPLCSPTNEAGRTSPAGAASSSAPGPGGACGRRKLGLDAEPQMAKH